MNGRGAGVSALFTVIKRTSSASLFFSTHTFGTILAVCVCV